jgi:hypothetical protein
MRKQEIKLPLTPITEETFERQGWLKFDVNEPLFDGNWGEDMDELNNDFFGGMEDEEPEEPIEKPEATAWYYILPIPKATDENGLLKEMGLAPGTFFVELMDNDGLGYCQSEEEIEILYKALTGKDLENLK